VIGRSDTAGSISVFTAMMLLCICVYGQKPPVRFGNVPKSDLLMTKYAKDSMAEAVILADYGVSSFERGSGTFRLNFQHTKRTKILKQEGVDYANFRIPLWHEDREDVQMVAKEAEQIVLKN